MIDTPALTGLDVLQVQKFAPLQGLRFGLVTHSAAVDSRLRSALEILAAEPNLHLCALFGPEHDCAVQHKTSCRCQQDVLILATFAR